MSIVSKNTVDSLNYFPASDYNQIFNISELKNSQIQTSNVNLMFVDPAVQDIENLTKTIADNTIAIVLDRDEDGIEQITQALEYFDDVPSLHLISHGQDGQLQLGSATINSSNISDYKDKFELWKSSFTEDADTLVYGCNVAGDYISDGIYSGDPLLGQLSHYTGTDVAASTDLTGSREKGGDWVLEREIGDIESGIGFKDTIRESYNSILPTRKSNSNLRIEAENLQRPKGFRIERNKLFSGGKGISLRGGKWNEQGRAVYVHKGAGGIYDLKLNYFDESDGTGNIRVLVNNKLVDRWSLNRNSSSGGISAKNRQVRTIKGLKIEAGDRITFVGKEHRKEFLRIDYFDLEQTNPLPPANPPGNDNPPGTIRIGAVQVKRSDLGPTLADTIREYDKLVKNAAAKGVDVLLFPEGISRIKTNNGKNQSFTKAAEDPTTGTLSLQYKEWASEHGMHVLGHIYEQDKGDSDIYNSQIIFDDRGKYIGTHRKILLPSGGELENLTPGNEVRVFDIENIKVGVAICYDVFGNKVENEPLGTMVNDLGAELIFYPNWSTEYDFAYPNLAELNVPFVVGTAMNNDFGGRQKNVLKTGVYDRNGDLISSEVLETSSGIAYADYDISEFE